MTTKPAGASRSEEIWAVLRDEILRGQYRAGERLPSERDLSTRFGANRGAVREALKKLEQMGIADITPGGVRVVPVQEATLDVLRYILDTEQMPEPSLINQVLEVLGALMAMSARTAIESASNEEVEQMKAIVHTLRHSDGDRERDAELWRNLGKVFTSINNNLVLRLILNGLKIQFAGHFKTKANPGIRLDEGTSREILDRLEQHIAARDAEAAADAVEDHFRLVRTTVMAVLNRSPDLSGGMSNG